MRISAPLLAPLMAAFVFTTAMADSSAEMQKEQQACETDVYTYCGDAIPNHDRIAACLKKNWSKISKECRKVMNDHDRPHRGKRGG